MRKILCGILVAASVGVTGIASAVTTTTNFQVTATVLKTCSATSAALGFGNYTPGAGALTGNTNINVNCTKNTPFTVSLNAGSTTGGSVAQRLMANGANTLQYNLYTTNAFATVFGDGSGSSVTQGGTGAGVASSVAVTVFGQLPDNATNQNAVPGSYADTIIATITY